MIVSMSELLVFFGLLKILKSNSELCLEKQPFKKKVVLCTALHAFSFEKLRFSQAMLLGGFNF